MRRSCRNRTSQSGSRKRLRGALGLILRSEAEGWRCETSPPHRAFDVRSRGCWTTTPRPSPSEIVASAWSSITPVGSLCRATGMGWRLRGRRGPDSYGSGMRQPPRRPDERQAHRATRAGRQEVDGPSRLQERPVVNLGRVSCEAPIHQPMGRAGRRRAAWDGRLRRR